MRNYLYIILVAALLFVPFLGSVHLFDWDEINFAESAREMLVSGNYFRVQINFEPFWEKPPLFFWMQVASMKLFGINEFAARFPNAICGLLTLSFLYYSGSKHFDNKLALWWVIAFGGSVLPFLYFKSGIIDPWFNLFIFISICFLYEASVSIEKNITSKMVWAGIFAGLAVLTKGPVALILISATAFIFIIINQRKFFFSLKQFFLAFICMALITLLWFGPETIINGPWFLNEFIRYQIRLFTTQDAGHGGPFFYHPLIIAIGCFPMAGFAIEALFRSYSKNNKPFLIWMRILFWVVLILFSVVKTKIVHYSSMCYLPLSFLAANTIVLLQEGKVKFNLTMKIITWLGVIIFSVAFFAVPIIFQHPSWIQSLIKDPFALACLQANANWGGWEWSIGIFFFISCIVAIVHLYRNEISKGLQWLYAATIVSVFLYMFAVVPRIEEYSQGAAIDFFKSKTKEDCYIKTWGYKSYAQFFYAQVKPDSNLNKNNPQWLLSAPIDKNVYFICKINRIKELEGFKELKMILNKNGFVVFKRIKQ